VAVTRTTFLAAIAAGLLLRLAVLSTPGTGDVNVWKVWMFNAAREGVGKLYGVGGSPPERRLLEYSGVAAPVDYPPLALVEFGAAGRLYRAWSHRRFPNADALNAFAKLPAFVAELGIAWLLFAAVRSRYGVRAARWTTIAYWLNPAAILVSSFLGYIDAQYLLPAVAAVVAAVAGWPVVAGSLLGAAVMTKAQAVFVAPIVVLGVAATCQARDWQLVGTRLARMLAAASAVIVVVTLPVIAAGGLPNMIQALSRLAQHDMVSANACNLWWIVGYLVRAKASMHDLGAWTAFTMPTRILGISRMIEIGYPNPRLIGVALTLTAIAWALWTARRARDLSTLAGVAAFVFHAYATLSAQVHENHLFAAVPFAVLAGAGLPAYRWIALGLSAVVALNVNIFYGFGNGIGYALPRGLTIVDATVVLAVMNCVLLWRHAQAIRLANSTAAESRRLPAPASLPTPATRTDSSATHI
jgi:hypothetical protein